MQRKITDQLKAWKTESHGRTAALVVGARRVGKSYSVLEFAKAEYDQYLLIDFSTVDERVKDIFIHNASDLETFFTLLTAFYQIDLPQHRSVIIFEKSNSSHQLVN